MSLVTSLGCGAQCLDSGVSGLSEMIHARLVPEGGYFLTETLASIAETVLTAGLVQCPPQMAHTWGPAHPGCLTWDWTAVLHGIKWNFICFTDLMLGPQLGV